jgi:hypothetical protein
MGGWATEAVARADLPAITWLIGHTSGEPLSRQLR